VIEYGSLFVWFAYAGISADGKRPIYGDDPHIRIIPDYCHITARWYIEVAAYHINTVRTADDHDLHREEAACLAVISVKSGETAALVDIFVEVRGGYINMFNALSSIEARRIALD
jgi:hypothetical protein